MVSGYAEKFKMAEPSDYPCSSSSEDDEYSDPLEVAASAGARLSTPEKARKQWKHRSCYVTMTISAHEILNYMSVED